MVKVSKIEIEIGDVQVSITPEQARELYQALGELVGEKEIVRWVPSNVPWYTYSISDGSTGDQPLNPLYTISCTSDTAKITV